HDASDERCESDHDEADRVGGHRSVEEPLSGGRGGGGHLVGDEARGGGHGGCRRSSGAGGGLGEPTSELVEREAHALGGDGHASEAGGDRQDRAELGGDAGGGELELPAP